MSYVALPAFRAAPGLDFSGLNEGLDVLGKTLERNRLLAQKQEIGKALQSGSGSQTSSSSPQYAPEPQQNKLLGNSSPAQYGANSVVDRITGVESGGNANATNSRSSATGLGQFTSGTWLDTIKKSRPDIASGKSDAELLSLRTDPNLSREMTGAYADSNGRMLQGAGYEASPGNTYLAHFAGPGGAKSVLGANPATPLTQILTPEAIRANPHIANMTAGDLRAWADRKMGGARPSAPSVSTSAPQGLNYQAGANKALSQGDLSTGLSLLDAQRENENTAYTRARQGRLDARAEATDAQEGELRGMQIEAGRAAIEKRANERVATIAQTIETSPAELVQPRWNQFVASNPKIAPALVANGIDPKDHVAGSQFLIAEARGLQQTTPAEFKTFKNDEGIYRAGRNGVEVIRQPGAATDKPPSAYRTSADGNLEYIPGGPADPNKTLNDAKFSEGASKAANFANMMSTADKIIGGLGPRDGAGNARLGSDGKPVPAENPAGFFGSIRESLPEGAANTLRDKEYQNYRQAAMQWVRAKLRKESGATISPSEFEGEFQTFFPQYGDGSEVIKQKSQAREDALTGMKAESRGAFEQMFQGVPHHSSKPPAAKQSSSPFPEYPSAKLAPDNHWYVEQNGQYFRVDQ